MANKKQIKSIANQIKKQQEQFEKRAITIAGKFKLSNYRIAIIAIGVKNQLLELPLSDSDKNIDCYTFQIVEFCAEMSQLFNVDFDDVVANFMALINAMCNKQKSE